MRPGFGFRCAFARSARRVRERQRMGMDPWQRGLTPGAVFDPPSTALKSVAGDPLRDRVGMSGMARANRYKGDSLEVLEGTAIGANLYQWKCS